MPQGWIYQLLSAKLFLCRQAKFRISVGVAVRVLMLFASGDGECKINVVALNLRRCIVFPWLLIKIHYICGFVIGGILSRSSGLLLMACSVVIRQELAVDC